MASSGANLQMQSQLAGLVLQLRAAERQAGRTAKKELGILRKQMAKGKTNPALMRAHGEAYVGAREAEVWAERMQARVSATRARVRTGVMTAALVARLSSVTEALSRATRAEDGIGPAEHAIRTGESLERTMEALDMAGDEVDSALASVTMADSRDVDTLMAQAADAARVEAVSLFPDPGTVPALAAAPAAPAEADTERRLEAFRKHACDAAIEHPRAPPPPHVGACAGAGALVDVED
jgi:hypothetical protein